MTDPRPFYLEHVALIHGWPAHAIARILGRHSAELEDLPPHLREPLEDAVAALRLAGERWAARGTAEPLPPELPLRSEAHDELDTAEAAEVLGITPRGVRKLAATGALAGTKRADRWSFDRGAVIELHDQRGEA